MNHRSRPDIPPQWRPSPSPHVAQLQEKSQPAHFPVIPDPRASLSSPPDSPLQTPPFSTFASKGPARTHPKQPPSDELQEIEDEEYVQRPYNPYNLPPASVIAVEVGSQSQSNNSLLRTSPRANLDGPVIPEDEDSDDAESRAITISTFFSPDLDARLPRTPDSDDNVGRRGRPVVPKRIASRGAGGAIRSVPRTTRASPMTTPTQSRFSRDTRDRDSHETSFACAGAKAVTNNSKRRNLAALLGIKGKGTNKSAPKVDENVMDLGADGGLDDPMEFETRAWGDAGSDSESWDEGFFAAGGGREDRGSGEGDGNGQWTDYLQTMGDALTIVSTDFVMPRAAPLPPNPSLPTIPTLTSLSPLALDDPTQNASVVTSTPRTKERAKKSLKRTGRIISTGFPSPTEMHPVPTTTFGLGLEGIEMELALALDTDFMDIDDCRDVDALDADGDVHMDQMTDVTPTMTTRTTITNGKTKSKSQAMDMQRQQQPTPAESTVRLPPTSLSLKTPFGGNTRSANFAASAGNLPGVPTTAKPFSLPHNKQLLLTRSLTPRTPLSGSKPPVQKLMGKTMISLPSVSTTVVAPRPARWTEPSQATPTQQPLSPSPTPSPETPCPPERLIQTKKPTRPVYAVEKALPVPGVAKGGERVEKVAPMNKDTQVYGRRAGTMDEVQMCAQIDVCIAATDRMEEVGYLLSVVVVSILTPPYHRLCALAVILTLRRLRLSVTC